MREKRKTPVQPSQQARAEAAAGRTFAPRYSVREYANAIRRAARKAGVAHWHPHQLRHTAATVIRAEFGIEVARMILGHSSTTMTELYAEQNIRPAIDAILKVG